MPNTHCRRDADATQLSRRRRRCVLNSQLAHDDCRRKFGNWTCWEFILSSWVELSCVGGVYTPVGCRDPVYNSAAYDWRRKLETGSWLTSDDWCVHTADATQLDSWVASASAVCIGFYRHWLTSLYRIKHKKLTSLQHRVRATKSHIQNSTNHFSVIMR